MLLRSLRRILLGPERRLAWEADQRRRTPALDLLRAFEREFATAGRGEVVPLGRLTDPRARHRVLGISRARLQELHAVASGATGSGKTSLGIGLTRALLRGGGVNLLSVDPKGDTSAALEALVLEGPGGDIPGEVKFIRPFDPQVVPQLRLTAPEPGVSPEVTALGLVSALEEALGAEMGLRMRSIAAPMATLAVELELPLGIIVAWLANPRAFADAAAGSARASIRDYARSQFPRESRESVSAIRSRLEAVLLLPTVRRALEARTFMPLEEWIERNHLNFDWSRPPAGQEAAVRILAGPVMGRLTRLLLNRSPGPGSPHLFLLMDEVQEITGRFESVALGRLLALARSRGVSCLFLHQQRSQLPRELQALIQTNAGVEFVFRPSHQDARRYAYALPVADDEPRPAALRASLLRKLERLPRRHYLLLVKDSPLGGQFLKAPEIRIPLLGPGDRVPSCGDPVGETRAPKDIRPGSQQVIPLGGPWARQTSPASGGVRSVAEDESERFPELG